MFVSFLLWDLWLLLPGSTLCCFITPITFDNRHTYRVTDISKKQVSILSQKFQEGISPNPFKSFAFGGEDLSHRRLSDKCSGNFKMNLKLSMCFENWFRLSTDTSQLSKTPRWRKGILIPPKTLEPQALERSKAVCLWLGGYSGSWLAQHCPPFPGSSQLPPTEPWLRNTSYLLSCSGLKGAKINSIMHWHHELPQHIEHSVMILAWGLSSSFFF